MRGLLNPDVRASALILLLVCEWGAVCRTSPGSHTGPGYRAVRDLATRTQCPVLSPERKFHYLWDVEVLSAGQVHIYHGSRGPETLKASRERAGWVCLGTNCTPYLMVSKVCFDDF